MRKIWNFLKTSGNWMVAWLVMAVVFTLAGGGIGALLWALSWLVCLLSFRVAAVGAAVTGLVYWIFASWYRWGKPKE